MMKFMFLFLIFCTHLSTAQNPVLVTDLRPGIESCVEDYGLRRSIQLEDKIFFVASNGAIESGLFVVENNKVRLIKDLCVGCSLLNKLVVYNGKVFFTTSENSKLSLWYTDGNEANTKLVSAIDHSEMEDFFVTDLLYFTSNKKLYIVNQALETKIISGINAKFSTNGSENPDFNKVCKYEDGIAHLTIQNDSLFLYKITDKPTLLGKTTIENTFTPYHGLNVVENGLVYAYEDAMYNWKKTTGKITKVSLPVGENIGRIVPFKTNSPLIYVYNNGFYILKGNSQLSITKLTSKWDNPIQSEVIPRAIYNEEILFFTDDYNTSPEYVISSDGTNTKETVVEDPYPSNFYSIGKNTFFATGTSNGFNPTLYNYNFESKKLTLIRQFSQSSLQSETIFILGVVGKRIFYLGNLDANVGRELYYLDTDISTATLDIDNQESESYYSINKLGKNMIVTNEQKSDEKIQLYIYGIDGKLIQKLENSTNVNIPISTHENLFVVMIADLKGQKVTSKVFTNN